MNIYEQVKQALQDVVAPELKELRAEIKRLDERVNSLDEKLSTKIDSLDKTLNARIDSLDDKLKSLRARNNHRNKKDWRKNCHFNYPQT